MNRLNSLQVYRGLAALAVILFHVHLVAKKSVDFQFFGGVFQGANIGVDFFFVLSGFIITYIHWGDLGKAEQAPRYLAKRFLRVYPLVFIACTIKLLFGLVPGGSIPEHKFELSRIVASYLLLPQDGGASGFLIAVLWTLTHEILFYAIFLFAILLGRTFTIWFTAVWALLIVLLHLPGGSTPESFFTHFLMSPCHLQFILGGVAAYLIRAEVGQKLAVPLGVISLVSIVVCWDLVAHATARDLLLMPRLIWGCVFATLIFATVNFERKTEIKFPKVLLLLGDASFSIYLFHTSFLKVGDLILSRLLTVQAGLMGQLYFWFLALGCTLGGLVCWWLFERPGIKYFGTWIERRFPKNS